MTDRKMIDPDITNLRSPVVRKALQYWHDRRNGRLMPRRSDIDPAELKLVLPHMMIFSVVDGGRDFVYRLVGSRIRDFLSADYTGQRLLEVEATKPADTILSNFQACMECRKPVLGNIPYVGPKSDFVTMEDIVLPLSSDGDTVDQIIVVLDFLSRLPDDDPA